MNKEWLHHCFSMTCMVKDTEEIVSGLFTVQLLLLEFVGLVWFFWKLVLKFPRNFRRIKDCLSCCVHHTCVCFISGLVCIDDSVIWCPNSRTLTSVQKPSFNRCTMCIRSSSLLTRPLNSLDRCFSRSTWLNLTL